MYPSSYPPPRFKPTPVALVAFALLHQGALAQHDDTQTPLLLKPSARLQEVLPKTGKPNLPAFLTGDKLSARPDIEAVAEGNAELRRGDIVLKADRIEYDQVQDLATARGQVRLNSAGNVYEGPQLQLKLESYQGFFEQPHYRFLKNDAYGQAERVEFLDDKRSVVYKGNYTTCRREPLANWLPAWLLTADKLEVDGEDEVGRASGAVLRFMDTPILPIPEVSFPLSSKRKSGFLPPTVGLDNVNGVEVTVPYYWNIAPNRDATLYPTLMLRRGVDLGAEFRYLEPEYKGQIRANVMPQDQLRDRDRWGLALNHSGSLNTGLTAVGNVGVNVNFNRVSDDNYWRDFPRGGAALTQRLLPMDAQLSWARGDFSVNFRAQHWQTLQDPSSPIVPPYDRAPQLSLRYKPASLPGGVDLTVEADTTRFSADQNLTKQTNAQRSYVLAQVSRPWQAPGWFVVPKLQAHITNYRFDDPLSNGARSADRFVPTFSLDGGLIFERDTQLFGRALQQTLEPRAFYVRTPYRKQNQLPNYDSGANDFNFATVYTENPFSGHDRIADAHLLTLGVTTRWLDATNGAEVARLGLAQRLRFSDQQVTLPGGTVVDERLSDLLLSTGIRWDKTWGLDSVVQYNPKIERSVRSTVGLRYSPGDFRSISAAYRLQRGQSEQLDIGWQWPLRFSSGQNNETPGTWYTVGRLNYSMKDKKLVDAILGLEYDGGCWLGRVVVERLQTGLANSNKRVLLQLEFLGFSRVGTNALKALKDNIPRYQYLREQVRTPSRFGNYD